MGTAITGLPGFRTERSAAYRNIRKSNQGVQYVPGGIVIDGTYSGDAGNTGNVDVLRAGKLMVKKNTGGIYRNFIIGKSTGAISAATVTSITAFPAAVVTEGARLIAAAGASVNLAIVGPPTAAGTNAVTAITVSAAAGTTLTVDSVALPAIVTDSALVIPTAGYTAGTFCFVDDGSGVLLSDQSSTRINQQYNRALNGGYIDESQIIDWPADTSAVAYLKGLLNVAGAGYKFYFDGPEVA